MTGSTRHPAARGARPAPALFALALGALVLFVGFFALGTWQIERRAWKLDLIDRIERRVHAPAVAAPGPDRWPQISAVADEYRHVRAVGSFLEKSTTLVQASTELGAGFWVLTPLRVADGSVVFVNRGFVTPEARDAALLAGDAPTGPTAITGLLRMPEPGGAFLRHNDAASDRWYSRDVQAIAVARGLGGVAPYFIDADAAADANDGSPGRPVGGLTVVAFDNHHLLYAITWYTLALMVAGATWRVAREEHRRRRRANDADVEAAGDEGATPD